MSDPDPRPPTHPAAGWNAEYIDEFYQRWKADPESVGESWQLFFAGFELSACPRTCVDSDQARDQSRVASLIYAYRAEGHRIADIDPLGNRPDSHPALELSAFDLEEMDLERVFDTGHLGGPSRAPLREIIAILKETYCGELGVEYTHIQDTAARRWLQARMEPSRNRPALTPEQKRETLGLLVDAELFEQFLQSRFLGQKRFSLEGGEAAIAGVHSLVDLAPDLGIDEIIMGMAHRGRLNVLANILDKSPEVIFSEFEDIPHPDMPGGDGDVKYHKGYSSTHVNRNGRGVRVHLTANPSHLEAVDPVVEGRVRAWQRRLDDAADRRRVLPLVLHGDAAFAGQGLVAETLNLSQLPGYRTGGTVHLIINNQIGFTTTPVEGRSTPYCSDVAKMVEAPVFHVNGDDPEAVVHAVELALRYRQEFGRDVVVDLVCYRRHGHNEADEPAYTQPVLYGQIKKHPSVRTLYTRQLLGEGVIDEAEAGSIAAAFREELEGALDAVRGLHPKPLDDTVPFNAWEGLIEPFHTDPVETGVPRERLEAVARALTTVPDGFALHRKIARALPSRMAAAEGDGGVDWALAELLAFGTLLQDGFPVRLSGQDSARGTFSHRHAVWTDTSSQRTYTPLNHLGGDQADFCVHNSMLSEAAVLGFEYGYSLDEPRMLNLWEAQFGDFANGAQVIIDQFVTASGDKWQRFSGLVMLLPHGSEGQGPEHSNAYLERYLAACAEDNIQVCNVTTPAQYFHLLRRQLNRPFRRPLVLMAPKSLLRHREVASPVAELERGHFREILDDPEPPTKARRLVLCSGKVYYDLSRGRREGSVDDVALVRVEQVFPLCEWRMAEIAARYGDVEEVIWAQEETANRGAWTFIRPWLRSIFLGIPVRYVGRDAAASPATGSMRVHRREQEQIVRDALGIEAADGEQ